MHFVCIFHFPFHFSQKLLLNPRLSLNSKLESKQMLSCLKMLFKEGNTSFELQELVMKEEMVKGEYLEEELLVVKEEEELMEIKEEVTMEKKEIKWGTMIPLVGGSALGCEKAAGSLPISPTRIFQNVFLQFAKLICSI